MGILDFDNIFDVLDASRRGYLSLAQVQQFDEALNFSSMDPRQVEAGVRQVCGPKQEIEKEQFYQVIQELQRRRNLEEKLRWDFMSLDKNGNNRLPVADALILFKLTHGDGMSIGKWRKFLASREDPQMDVYWDEIKVMLCDHPDQGSNEEEYQEESDRLDKAKQQETIDDFEAYQINQDDGTTTARKYQGYREKTSRLARRKMNRWEREGVEGLIYDDGIDRGEHIPVRTRDFLGLADLMEALNLKYELLRKALFTEMLKEQFGENTWAAMSLDDQSEAFETLQLEEREMRKDGTLKSKAIGLYGAGATLGSTLEAMMGELPKEVKSRKKELESRRSQLKDDGLSNMDADAIIRKETDSVFKVSTSADVMLVALAERQSQERDNILAHMSSTSDQKWSGAQVMTEYGRIVHQHTLAQLESDQVAVTTAMGLAERSQMFKQERYDPERARQESLAHLRLTLRQSQTVTLPWDEGEGARVKGQGLVELQLEVIREMAWKHAIEREVLINLLQGPQSEQAKLAGCQMSGDTRNSTMSSLRSERKQLRSASAQYLKSQREQHLRILQEGAGIYHCMRGEELALQGCDSFDGPTNAAVLADLQQKQDQERDQLFFHMQGKNEKELGKICYVQRTARLEDHFDNVAAVLLGTFESSEEEQPYLDALDTKFEALRTLLLTHQLKMEHGIAWYRLTPKEQQKLIQKKLSDERRLRQDGKMAEMIALLTMIPQDIGTLRHLMGEDKAEYIKRIAKVYAHQNDPSAAGQLKHYLDEVPAKSIPSKNLLADLQQRYYAEQDCLIGQLRSHDARGLTQHDKWLHMVLMRIETRRAEKEEWFDEGAISIGLFERGMEVIENRHKTDNERHEHLARRRVLSRQKRLQESRPYHKEVDDYARPEKGDMISWMEAYLKEIDKKHYEEREILLRVLQDPALEELRSLASGQNKEELEKRLGELWAKRNRMNMERADDREENQSLIEEAAAIRSVLKRQVMQLSGGEITHEDVIICLLSSLQNKQDVEMAMAVTRITKMSEEDLKLNREYEINMRHWEAAENVIVVLTKYEGSAEDDDLVKALDEKYDALRDKLLMEALMKQMSEAEWKKLSEQERQKRLAELRLKEKRLRQQGKYDELARLLGEGQENDAKLRQLMGDNKAEYERKLKERLARRQRRIEQGLDPDDDEEELEDEKDEKTSGALEDLQRRYEKEKEALLAQLRGVETAYLTESERQAELVRLRREKRLAERENDFEKAALMIGLAEKQQVEANERMNKERQRQEQLARQRLLEMRKKSSSKKKLKENIIQNGSKMELEEAVLVRLDERQEMERELFLELTSMSVAKAKAELRDIAKNCTQYEIQEKLELLLERRSTIRTHPEKVKDNKDVLHDAFIVKFEGRRLRLCHDREENGEKDVIINDEDIMVSLLADLQERHDREAEEFIKKFRDQSEEDLVNLQRTLVTEIKHQIADNLSAILFAAEVSTKGGKAELLNALDEKYDVLRDKLIMEALMNQYGEAEWNKMSERERQRKKMEMRLEERRLRKEGDYETAAALLGESAKQHEILNKMMGQSREEYEQKMRERLEKRKQRLANGMSEEECDALEKEEDEEERKRHNILKDLQQNYDKEKEELMRRLQAQEENLTREQRRQLELSRLKREQRKAQKEEKFDAAAILLGMASQQEADLERNRSNQEQLARERLEARLKQLREKRGGTELNQEEVPLPENEEDRVAMQEALITEMELNHANEREILLRNFEDPSVLNELNKYESMDLSTIQVELETLAKLRKQWEESGRKNPEEQMNQLKTATALALAKAMKMTEEGTQQDHQVSILATLQQMQDKEKCRILKDLENQSLDVIKQLKMVQATSRRELWLGNLASTLFEHQRDKDSEELNAGEKEVMEALDKKYDTLRDKLIADALMKQVGEEEWRRLSEQERQKRLAEMKLKERRLRQEGRMDEAAGLLGGLAETEQDLVRKLGESKSEQQRLLAERLERKRQLQKEREEKGLSTDDAILTAIVIEEEEKEKASKRKNVLTELQHHYEDEKQALLASLRDQESRLAAERHRQLELARLRKDQKTFEKQDKFDSAALLLSLAEEQEKNLEANFANQRERQRALARERLAARRNKAQKQKEEETQLPEDEELAKAIEVTNITKEGMSALQEIVLEGMEKKQEVERDLLMDLADKALKDPSCLQLVASTPLQDISAKMEGLSAERQKWRKQSRLQAAKAAALQKTTSEAVMKETMRTMKSKNEQNNILLKATALKIQAEMMLLKKDCPDLSEEALKEEVLVYLLASLQQRQEAETKALISIMPDQEENGLSQIKKAQQTAINEGWFDALCNTLFTLTDLSDDDNQEESEVLAQAEADINKAKDQMEEEFEKEKQNLKEKLALSTEQVDADALMAKLEADQLARKEVLDAALNKQRQMAQAKLAAKREARDSRNYEKEAAAEMLKMASRQQTFVQQQASTEQQRQGDLMQQRLEARRQARLAKRQQEEEEEKAAAMANHTSSSVSSEASLTGTADQPMPPGATMKRRKTVVDVNMSENEKNEMYMQLVREQTVVNKRLSMEHRRHEDMLKKRLQDMKERKMSEASALIALGERQRTTLEKQRKSEQEKQLTATKERVARLRYEKTMTMKESGNKSTRKFQELVDEDAKGMSEDEKMALAARKLEDKFKREDGNVKTTVEENPSKQAEPMAHHSQEDKLKALKAKREQKKRERQATKAK